MSTPQDVALSDVRKGIAMLRKVSVPVSSRMFVGGQSILTQMIEKITGLILNQAYYLCPGCQSHEPRYLFGENVRSWTSLILIFVLQARPIVLTRLLTALRCPFLVNSRSWKGLA